MTRRALLVVACCGLALGGCGSLLGPTAPPPTRLSLDAVADGSSAAAVRAAAAASAPVLVVTPPTAVAPFASDRMIWLKSAQQPQPYADHAWVDEPPRMLAPLAVGALADTGAFSAVISTPSSAVGQVQLDTQVLRLQHEVPGRVRFTLRATLVDKRGAQQRVLSRDFEAVANTPSDDAAGFATAARAAVREVLGKLAAFCVESTKG